MPRILDLFCGGGGASAGYARAGFEVVGVDIEPQPRYPWTFIQADAMTYPIEGFDAVHASPPCQGYSGHVYSVDSRYAGTKGTLTPLLIDGTRDRLHASGLPFVIENVVSAKHWLWNPLLLCGSMFPGILTPRHRVFEANWALPGIEHPDCSRMSRRNAEERGWEWRDMSVTGKGRHAGTLDRWKVILDWPADLPVTQHAMREAIPPAYTAWLGERLLRVLSREDAA